MSLKTPPASLSKPPSPPVVEAGRRRGCLRWCLCAVLLLVVVVVGLLLVARYRVRALTTAYDTDAMPRVPVLEVTAEQARQVEAEWERFVNALAAGTPSRFEADTWLLNALIACVPEYAHLRGMIRLDVTDEAISVDGNLPLDTVPGMRGRFVAASIGLDVGLDDGGLAVHARDVRIRNRQVPKRVAAEIARINLAAQALDDSELRPFFRHITDISVRDGRLVVEISDGPSARDGR